MNDMTMLAQQPAQTQQTQQTRQTDTAKKRSDADDEKSSSFSEVLDSAIDESKKAETAQQLEKEAAELGGQAAAQTILTDPLLAVVLTATPTEETATAAVTAFTQEAAPQPVQPMQDEIPQAVLDTAISMAQQAPEAETDAAQPIPIVAVDTAADDGSELLHAQTQFQRSVEQAQHMLKNSDSESSRSRRFEILTVDELQQKVNSGEYLSTPQQQRSGAEAVEPIGTATDTAIYQPLDTADIFSQIKVASDRQAQTGTDDFTIKLKPEGLGEITVKLVMQDGRVTMSLSASDANVQRMLGSQLNDLRDVMRPYNVEVAQVAESNSAAMADLQQQLQQQSQQQFSGRQAPAAFADSYSEPAAEDVQTAQTLESTSMLDAYI